MDVDANNILYGDSPRLMLSSQLRDYWRDHVSHVDLTPGGLTIHSGNYDVFANYHGWSGTNTWAVFSDKLDKAWLPASVSDSLDSTPPNRSQELLDSIIAFNQTREHPDQNRSWLRERVAAIIHPVFSSNGTMLALSADSADNSNEHLFLASQIAAVEDLVGGYNVLYGHGGWYLHDQRALLFDVDDSIIGYVSKHCTRPEPLERIQAPE